MSTTANTLAAALRGRQLATVETKRAVMFLELFLKLSDLHQADILHFMQAYACTSAGSGAEKPFR